MIERVWWKKKPSCTVDGNVNGTGTGEQNEVPYKTKNRPKKKLKIDLFMIQQSHSWSYIQRKL